MEIVKKIILLILVVVISGYLSVFAINLYDKFFNSGSAFVQLHSLVGFPLAYVFFLSLLFTAFGGRQKYWWMGILLIPAAAVELYLDASHIYFPMALGVVGWFVGWVITKFLPKR